jgi:protein SCO1
MKQALPLLVVLTLFVSCSKPLPVLGELPDFSLINQEGSVIQKADLLGKAWIANFVFTRCGDVCPMLTKKMSSLQASFPYMERTNLRLVTFTVDPENDSPSSLKSYGKAYGAQEGWIFLTGPLQDVERTIVEGFKLTMGEAPPDTDAFGIMHGDKFVLVDKRFQIRGYYSMSEISKLKKGAKAVMAEK